RPNATAPLDLRAYDELLRHTDRPPATDRVSIVAVDDKSIDEIGQWPWGRDVLAQLLERLRGLGARVIALDIILSEPDRLGAPPPSTSRGSEAASTTTDAALAATLAEQRFVTGYAFMFDGSDADATHCLLHPLPVAQITAPG